MKKAVFLLAMAWALAGPVVAAENAATSTSPQAEKTVIDSQLGVISTTVASGTQPLNVSLTAVANCGKQGKFYYTTKNSCCSIKDTAPACTDSNPGSQAFTSPGTFSFTVPAYSTLTAVVKGGGGGGAGALCTVFDLSNTSGKPGGASSFAGVVSGGGGGGGLYDITNFSAGSPGTGSGGDSNTTGSGGAAGSGAASTIPGVTSGPNGAAGGAATKTWSKSTGPAQGSVVTVVVGAGGAGGYGAGCNGGAGGTGSVNLTWN